MFFKAAIALFLKDKKLAKIISDKLKQLEIKEPYFFKFRDSIIISLLTLISEDKKHDTQPEAKSVSIIDKGKDWTDFFILQPNFMGMGIDLRKLLAKFQNKKSKSNE